jgi:hypothetical protein
MVDESLYATRGYVSVIRWVDPSIDIDSYTIQRVLSVGTDTTIAGDVMATEGESQGYVDIAAESDLSFLGVCLGPTVIPTDYDLDDVIADGETVNILRPTGGRTIISVILASHTGAFQIEEGDYLRVGDTAGQVESWVYTDNADSTDTMQNVIGKSATDITTSATDDQIINVWY